MRDIITTINNRYVCIDTSFVPFPLGRNCYETIVFKCTKAGKSFGFGIRPLDERQTTDKATAELNHWELCKKWKGGDV